MNITNVLMEEFSLKEFQVENTIKLIDEGNTIPFIARYRKEMTGSLDDQILRELSERLQYLRNLEEKRESVKALIAEQDKLTEEIEKALEKAVTITEIDDIYRPFRPKRRTRATIAKEKGLEPLATEIMLQMMKTEPIKEAEKFINLEKEVNTAEDALNGAMDIIAEIISDDADNRAIIRKATFNNGLIVTKAVDSEAESVYEMYYDYSEPIKKAASHRILAINRGEKEKILSVKIEAPEEEIYKKLHHKIILNNAYTSDLLKTVIEDSYKRLISPSIEREIRNELTEKAEDGAIKVFGQNLKQLLLQPPIKDKVVLALDPGFRTGCKVAVVNGIGKVLEVGVIYPLFKENQILESEKKILKMIDKYKVDIIAIGNGTASRETEMFVVNLIKKENLKVQYIIVNEAGASVYSASKLGAEEFPDFDVALRSAVSLARRLQDPLAELV
ncbi:MAG: Tex-like N-terminal domain-containing protein, partial [Lachnospirales bacterium]